MATDNKETDQGGNDAALKDLDGLLKSMKQAAKDEAEQAAQIMNDHLAQSQLVVANVAALQSSKDPMDSLVAALAIAAGNPTREAIA